ncbi:hypothetical protein [Nocardiopsis synnemataformans]|uniref:hypothetical protein n=1 Tax=Nocardiopsis synnemataformans TaxID=61305 RepID=UPI003EBA9AD9
MTTAAAPALTTPPRGSGLFPAWFETHASGWICSHPHGPDDVTEELGHPPHLIDSYALRHLNDHHPGWKLPCTRCGTPQWNELGSTRCYRCRQ